MKKYLLALFSLCCILTHSTAQLITPAPGNSTVCPGEGQFYTFAPDVNSSNCGNVTWTVTHGSFSPTVQVSTIITPIGTNQIVYWDDYAGNGILAASSTCSVSGVPTLTSRTSVYAIKSLAGRDPANLQKNQTLPYCSTASVLVQVDLMNLLNTGGTTGITQQQADGYEWTVPAGWTGSSTTNLINVTPTNGCVGGTISVKAYVNCTSGRKYSNPASISLNRPAPNMVLSAPGYAGPSCGNRQPVTFTVTGVPSCVLATNGYSWIFPAGWNTNGAFTSTNSITVTPSGNDSDGGPVTVTAYLNCGTTFPATKTLVVGALTINASPLVCVSGTPVSLSGVSNTVPVTWSSAPANIVVTSGQGTSNATIAAPAVGSYGSTTLIATANCFGSIHTATLGIWVGTPSQPGAIIGNTTPNVGSIYNYYVNPGPNGAPTFNWIMPYGGDPLWSWWGGSVGGPINTLTPNFMVGSSGNGRLQMYGINNCGNGAVSTLRVFPQGGPCVQCPRIAGDLSPTEDRDSTYARVVVYPNPTSTEFIVRLKEPTTSEAALDLIDISGDVKKTLTVNSGTQFVKVTVDEILAGIYVVRVKEGVKTYSKKILIQH